MSRIFSFVALLAWALWLGGLITLFVCVTALFHDDRAMAAQAAPHLFLAFERSQLIVAAVALSSTFAWWLSGGKMALLNMVFLFFALAGLGAVASPVYFTRRMETLREQGASNSAEFRRLHGQSMGVYCGEATMLVIGGMFLFAALRKPAGAKEIKPA